MTNSLCTACSSEPSGEAGHEALAFYVEGPFPGRHIFKCRECSERWIRSYGSPDVRFAWSRYSDQYETRTPRADPQPAFT